MSVSCKQESALIEDFCLVCRHYTGDEDCENNPSRGMASTNIQPMDISTLLAEAFPLCFSALYCHSLRGFGCSRFVLVVNQPRKRPLPTAACDSC